MDGGWLPETESDVTCARNDIIAWIGGGLVWTLVMTAINGAPEALLLGAALAFLLRRTLRLLFVF